MNILSIDWDFFFDDASSLGSYACPHCSWEHRCRNYGYNNRPVVWKPGLWCDPDSPKVSSLKRTTPVELLCSAGTPKAQGAEFYVAECHADIWPILGRRDFILNVDAHMDCWPAVYPERRDQEPDNWLRWVDCGNWGNWAQEIHNAKIAWLDTFDCDEEKIRQRHFGRRSWQKVFCCQSRPWTPKGWDHRFYRFLHDLHECFAFKSIEFLGPHAKRLKAGFDRERVRR